MASPGLTGFGRLAVLGILVARPAAGQDPGRLYPIEAGGLGGYIDRQGEGVISPRFDEVRAFHHGLAAVRQGERWGFVNDEGAWVVQPRFAGPSRFSEGLAVVLADAGDVPVWEVVDAAGRVVWSLPQGARPESVFREGLLRVRAPGRFTGEERVGFKDKEGAWAVRPAYLTATDFSEGLATVQRRAFEPLVIDRAGRVRIGSGFAVIGEFADGRAPASRGPTHQGLLGYIDREGELVVAEKFADAAPFREGLARVLPAGFPRRYGYINRRGEVAVPPVFEVAGDFASGRARAFDELRGSYGYITAQGRWAFPARFREAADFEGELARVAWEAGDGRATALIRGYVNRDGQVVWPPDAPPPPAAQPVRR